MPSLENMNFVATPGSIEPQAAPAPPIEMHAARPLAHAGASVSVSVLGWPAWLRLLAVLPAVVLLWLGVAWAQLEVAPW